VSETYIQADDPRLRFIALDKASALKEGIVYCYLNRWWAVHPEKGVIFYRPNKRGHGGSPQCNNNEAIVRQLTARLYPWAEVRLIPVVIERVDPSDYCG
jgi:hypothetical protein